jgi:Zn-dependent protease
MIVAAAGPLSNLAQALVAGLLLAVIDPGADGSLGGSLMHGVLRLVVTANVFLAVFNLIPVPPLDGGNVLAGLLPRDAARVFDNLRPYGFIILYAMMFTGVLSSLIVPPANFLVRIFLP